MRDAFSIIIPVYNASEYLRKLLTELLRQKTKYPQTQIIVIDDGSEEDMSWLDSNQGITVIHQENGGEAKARNVGLDLAVGEYLAWIDCDDMIPEYYLDTIYKNARKGFDYVVYTWKYDDGRDGIQHKETHLWNWNVWSYTYKREIITERFDESRNVASDYYWLEKQIRPEMTRLEVDVPIILYNDKRPDSITNLLKDGKIKIWRDGHE